MSAKAVLHIGTKKTGTTHLQEFLLINQGTLKECGWDYPEFLNNRNHLMMAIPFTENKATPIHQAMQVSNSAASEAAISELDAQLAAKVKPGQKWIFTSEFFASRLRAGPEVQTCLTFLRKHFTDIEVLVYCRRPEFMVASTYSQSVKEGATIPLDLAYVESRQHDFAQLDFLNLWSGAVGADKIIARPYFEHFGKNSRLIIDDFLGALGIPQDADWVEPARAASNPRLSTEGVEVLRTINFVSPRPDNYSRTLVRQRAELARRVQATTGGERVGLTEELTLALQSKFANQNNQVAARYKTQEWQDWLAQPPKPPASSAGITVTNTRLAEVLIGLIDETGTVSPGFIAQTIGRLSTPLGIVNWSDPAGHPNFTGWRRKIRTARSKLQRK